jgi:hypothetical protein
MLMGGFNIHSQHIVKSLTFFFGNTYMWCTKGADNKMLAAVIIIYTAELV